MGLFESKHGYGLTDTIERNIKMKSTPECFACFLKQSLNAVNLVDIDDESKINVLKQIGKEISNFSSSSNPAENSSLVFLKTYELIDNSDPFMKGKRESNDLALRLYDKVKKIIDNSEDKLLTAIKASAAGNVIDMGINPDFDIDAALDEIEDKEFAKSNYLEFKAKLLEAENIMILGDNSGEIVFDKFLIEQLENYEKNVTYVVKGGPILNDATLEDAEYVGIKSRVITNGANFVGTIMNRCSREFIEEFNKAELIISKGQGNYESLEEYKDSRIFFILRAKCDIIAKSLGVNFSDIVFLTKCGD